MDDESQENQRKGIPVLMKEVILETPIGIFRACLRNESGEMLLLTEAERNSLVCCVHSMYKEYLEEEEYEI